MEVQSQFFAVYLPVDIKTGAGMTLGTGGYTAVINIQGYLIRITGNSNISGHLILLVTPFIKRGGLKAQLRLIFSIKEILRFELLIPAFIAGRYTVNISFKRYSGILKIGPIAFQGSMEGIETPRNR